MQMAYVFPGQGSQFKGMGGEILKKFPSHVEQADEVLGYSIEELCLKDERDVLSQTQYTQPALYTVNCLMFLERTLDGRRMDGVSFLAGHSLGEYCALFAAGAFDFATGLRLVQRRGLLMSQAPKGAMAAVLGLRPEVVRSLLAGSGLDAIDLANINSSDQVIISGLYSDITAGATRQVFEEAGATYFPLNVSAAFHSRYMADVQERFSEYLSGFELRPLKIPVISNVTGRPYPRERYADVLSQQISRPVRWYEAISWLLSQDCRAIEEIGPGAVLTKLASKILQAPMPIIEERPTPSPAATARTSDVIFMYGGQGTQYFQMGRELYRSNTAFRKQMDACSAFVRPDLNRSLVEILYEEGRAVFEPFDDILHTHPALFSIGYSLTVMLRAEGVEPRAALGYSLGEHIGLTTAGYLSWEDGLRLTMRQARMLSDHCPAGGMLSVLAPAAEFEQRPDIYQGVELAGINFAGNFCVAGPRDVLARVKRRLDDADVISLALPVQFPFHSRHVDPIREKVQSIVAGLEVRSGKLPYYSSALQRAIHQDDVADLGRYIWNVIRQAVNFHGLVKHLATESTTSLMVDLSPTGSMANFIKYSRTHLKHAYSINQFGKDLSSVQALLGEIEAFRETRACQPISFQ